MFGHEFGEPVWILGIINNTNKDFRLGIANSRDKNTIKAFVSRHVKKGNKICTMVGHLMITWMSLILAIYAINTIMARESMVRSQPRI